MGPELSPRLSAAAELIPPGARLADVGCDHAYLPVKLLLSGQIPWAIASDLRPGPLQRARRTAEQYGCAGRISFRLCPGLSRISPGEVDAVAVAGMGGETIAGILSAAAWVKEKRVPLILQPMSSLPELRRWLWQNGFALEEERLVREGRRFYPVLLARAGEMEALSPAEEWAGRQRRGMEQPLRGEYLELLLEKTGRALEGQEKARDGSGERGAQLRQLREALMKMKKEWEQWHG